MVQLTVKELNTGSTLFKTKGLLRLKLFISPSILVR